MTSYLRYIFGGSQSKNTHDQPSTSHSRTRSNPTPNYFYGPPAGSGSPSSSRLKTKRSNSFCARTATPSPLRYTTFEAAANAASQTGDTRYGSHSKADKTPPYRRASYKSSEHLGHYPLHTPHAPSVSFGAHSRTNSSSSLLPGMVPPTTPSVTSHTLKYERRPSLRNHTWQSSISSATGSTHSYNASMDHHANGRPPALHMHPLFAATRLHSAPISYDVTYTPSSRTVLDRTTHTAVPAHTLAQPATDPPTPASSRIVLRSEKFPWPVLVGPCSSSSTSSSSSSHSHAHFHVGGAPAKSGGRSSNITNLDLLYALHSTLLTRVTPQEWEALGHGSRAQRKVTRAYEKRCTKMGGGWEGGVRRVDWLHSKTRLVGIEVEKHGSGVGSGKLVFSKA